MLKVRQVGVTGFLVLCAILLAGTAFAQGNVPSPSKEGVDFSPILVALVNNLFPIVAAVATYLINANVKNQQMATLLSNAVQNAVGTVQQKALDSLKNAGDSLYISVDDPAIRAGTKYVLEHAKEAVAHFKIDEMKIAEKLQAKIGLASIQTNLAATASTVPGVTGPLAPAPAIHN